jgi:hypothetical protein
MTGPSVTGLAESTRIPHCALIASFSDIMRGVSRSQGLLLRELINLYPSPLTTTFSSLYFRVVRVTTASVLIASLLS